MLPHLAGDMGKHIALAGKIDAEHRARQHLRYRAFGPSLAMAGEYILQRASFKADAPDPLKPWANIPEVALVSTTRRSRAVRATS